MRFTFVIRSTTARSSRQEVKSFASIARDQFGNGLGGIRLAEMEVPVAHEGGETCGLGGTHVPFTTAALDALYPNHGTYVSRVVHAANASVEAGFVLPEDAQATIDK